MDGRRPLKLQLPSPLPPSPSVRSLQLLLAAGNAATISRNPSENYIPRSPSVIPQRGQITARLIPTGNKLILLLVKGLIIMGPFLY